MAAPRVDFLFWSECPSHERALAELGAAMVELGLDPAAICLREIGTREEAEQAGFPGSPTIRVDGVDVRASDEPPRLTCRVYRRRDGRVSPTPDPLDLREALAAAAATDNQEER